MPKDINPTEGDEPTEPLTPTDGDELEDDSEDLFPEALEGDDDDEELTDEQKELALKAFRKVTGKNWKSLEKAAKSLKHAEVVAAERGKPKDAPRESPTPPREAPTKKNEPGGADNSEIVEELLLTKHPEAEHVLNDKALRAELESVAKAKKTSILKAYRESKYFQSEAKSRAEEAKLEEENKNKVKDPATAPSGDPKQLFENMTDEKFAKLTTAQKNEYFDYQLKKERNVED